MFDCAARFGNTSLNENVLQGPDLTNNLVGVLLRFRQEPVALMADIESMFHQVKVSEEDTDVLHFLWWEDGDMNNMPAEFKMTVHLFGGTWSPSCCNFALKRVADQFCDNDDHAVRSTIKRNFYVDDCLKSTESVQEAVELT